MDQDMIDALYGLLEDGGYLADGWEIICESTLMTPDGYIIEWDGRSPSGEVSPMLELGII